MKRKSARLFYASLLVICLLFAAAWTVWAGPKLLSTAKAGDCKACHGADKVLPAEHPGTQGMDWKGCKACHMPDKANLIGKIPASHVHLLSGITCVKCHGKAKKQEAVDMKTCVACHGSPDALAAKTADVKPTNPHTSPHYGTTLDCNLCHHQHAKSENYCSQCHQFNFKVP